MEEDGYEVRIDETTGGRSGVEGWTVPGDRRGIASLLSTTKHYHPTHLHDLGNRVSHVFLFLGVFPMWAFLWHVSNELHDS